MIYYFVPYLFLFLTSILSLKIRGNGYKLLFLFGFFPAILVVILRGLTGTDTYTYLTFLSATQQQVDENYYNIELGFLLYTRLINFLEIDAQVALNFFGFVICILLYINLSKTKHAFIIFSSLIFPIFFYDMTMNGVRYGLAFVLAVPFILEPIDKIIKINKNKVSFLLSILNHNSALIFVFFKLISYLNLKNFILFLIVSSSAFFIMQDYLLLKFNDYSSYESPGALSGLQPLILMLLIIVLNSTFFRENIKRNFFLFFLQLYFYGITQISYAGIRLQFAVLFFMVIFLILDQYCKNYKLYIFFLYLIGILGFAFKSRNMLDGYGVGFSPFLPYSFFWS